MIRLGLTVAAVLSAAASAEAQNANAAMSAGPRDVRIAASEKRLVITLSQDARTTVLQRSAGGELAQAPPLNAVVARLAIARDSAFAFVAGGAAYALRGAEWVPELNLPGRALPLSLAAHEGQIHALIRAPASGDLPQAVDGERPTDTRPFDPRGAAAAVVRYDDRGWIALAAAPPEVSAAGGAAAPKMASVARELQVFWLDARAPMVKAAALDVNRGEWRPLGACAGATRIDEFWVTTVAGTPTIVLSTSPEGEAPELRFFRKLGRADDGSSEWRAARVEITPAASGVQIREIDDVAGFNQHAAILARDTGGGPHLLFARFDEPPLESATALNQLLRKREQEITASGLLQALSILALLFIVLGLFTFRRNAMVQSLALPRELAPAFTFQRLAALAIDLTPFALAAGLVTGVDWRTGLGELFEWAVGLEAAGRLPPARTLRWWLATTAACAAYATVMEILLQRTLGKLVLGTRVVTETGAAPSAAQVVGRNVMRFMELQPPLWMLGFLVLLSRNRQRAGDIFARTVTVRRAPLTDAGSPSGGQSASDDSAAANSDDQSKRE